MFHKAWVSPSLDLFVFWESTVCIQCQFVEGILWLDFVFCPTNVGDGLENSCSKEDLTNFPLHPLHDMKSVFLVTCYAIFWGRQGTLPKLAGRGIRANPEPTSCENVRISDSRSQDRSESVDDCWCCFWRQTTSSNDGNTCDNWDMIKYLYT